MIYCLKESYASNELPFFRSKDATKIRNEKKKTKYSSSMQPTLASTVIIVTTLKILDINVDSFVSCGTISSNITAEETSRNESSVSSSKQNSESVEGT